MSLYSVKRLLLALALAASATVGITGCHVWGGINTGSSQVGRH